MSEEWKKQPWKNAVNQPWKNSAYNSWKNYPVWRQGGSKINDQSPNLKQNDDVIKTPGLYFHRSSQVGKTFETICSLLNIKVGAYANSANSFTHAKINSSQLDNDSSYLSRLIVYAATPQYRIMPGVSNSLGLSTMIPNDKTLIERNTIELKESYRNIVLSIPGPFYRQAIYTDKRDMQELINLPNINSIISLTQIRARFDANIHKPDYKFLYDFLFLRDLDALFFASMLFSFVQIGEQYLDTVNSSDGYVDAIRDFRFMQNSDYYLNALRIEWLPIKKFYPNSNFNNLTIEYPMRSQATDNSKIVRYFSAIDGLNYMHRSSFTLTFDVVFNNGNENGTIVSSQNPPIPDGIDPLLWNNIFMGLGIIVN